MSPIELNKERFKIMSTFFWYDFETTGINPRCDRPIQVAGIRTDEALNEIEVPLNLYCQLSPDILPHPMACLVTGITPRLLADKGLCEAEFMTRLHAELSRPGTCSAGYNSLRFDDEMVRYSLFRNFFDPYAREWQNGNSRWDLIDLMRTAYALRPEGMIWPEVDGQVSLKLELLTQANGIGHERAHDALSDVRATIALARLMRERQRKLYDYLFNLRQKWQVLERITLLRPFVHVSGRFSAARRFLSVVLPLAWHPTNRNALIVCDLDADISPLFTVDADTLRRRLYTRRDALAADETPVPLKLVHVNRCPVFAPITVLRKEDLDRLPLDLHACRQRMNELVERQSEWQLKLVTIYTEGEFSGFDDPEQQLYQGFLNERDRRLCEQVRQSEPAQLGKKVWQFDDTRMASLLFRYRARNFPELLNNTEFMQWREFCRHRLMKSEYGAPNLLPDFEREIAEYKAQHNNELPSILVDWQQYVSELKAGFDDM